VASVPKIPINPLIQQMAPPTDEQIRQAETEQARQQEMFQKKESRQLEFTIAKTEAENRKPGSVKPVESMQLVKTTHKVSQEIDDYHNADQGIRFNLSSEQMDRHTEKALEPITIESELEADLRVPMTAQQLTEQVISKAFFEDRATPQDLAPYRVKVAWRLIREMCRMKGLAHPEDTLIDAVLPTSRNIDPWIIPEKWKRPAGAHLTTLSHISIKYYKQTEDLAEKFQYKRHVLEVAEGQPDFVVYPGLALLPPPIPWQWWEQDQISKRRRVVENYDPHEDLTLVFYMKIVNQLAQELQIADGSFDDPDQGRYGLKGLTDVETIRELFPSRFQIVAYEELLIEETLNLMTQYGQSRARRYLRSRHGFSRREVEGLCKIAKAWIRKQLESDIEEDRAFMVTRLEDFVRRARVSLDLRAELAGMKQLTIVLGLARSEMGDAMSDFLNVVSDVSGSRGPLPQIEEGDFEVIR